MFVWRETVPPETGLSGVEWGFTDAAGGVSAAPWAGLNLGSHVGDDPEAVATNRLRVAEALGLSPEAMVLMSQVHGAQVLTHDPGAVGVDAAGGPVVGECDAVVTRSPDHALVVLVADCTPVLLVDRRAGLAAAVHAGRPGMLAGVVAATADRLRSEGASDLEAVVGPSVCGRCYEVPAQMREDAQRVAPASAAVSWAGTPAVDVAAGVVSQLGEAGVRLRAWVPGCTRESPGLYSYRRDGQTGRFAGVVRLLAPAP